MVQITAGVLLVVAGVAGATRLVPGLNDYVYPLLWWGVLCLVDMWNRRRHGLTLWRLHTLAVTVPVSVLFWVFFEVLNLVSPQWRYVGGLESLAAETAFGFIAFATVIPITVESWWAVAGELCMPFRAVRPGVWLGAAAVFAAIPFFNHVFWWNQGMWLVPGLVVLPWTRFRKCGSWGRWVAALAVSGLLSGIAWESFNWLSRTHWEYTILRSWPHLFQMPVLGYLGFIPFAASGHAAYEWQRRIPAGRLVCAVLYGSALGLIALLTVEYRRIGLWVTAGG